MKDESLCFMVLLLFLSSCDTLLPKSEYIYSFVYGQSVPDEQITYYYNGEIPDLVPIHIHKINEQKLKPHLEKNFTFLKVEYLSPVSTVYVEYFPATYTLKFTIVVPLVPIKFAVAAFALKKKSRRQSRSSLNVVYLKIE